MAFLQRLWGAPHSLKAMIILPLSRAVDDHCKKGEKSFARYIAKQGTVCYYVTVDVMEVF
jgi:hypothetical protein